jgi:rod shape-determining protein MreC
MAASRPSTWGWSPAGRRRYVLITLWLAHAVWVFYGRGTGKSWVQAADGMARPTQSIANASESWRDARRERLNDLDAANAELDRLRQRVKELESAREQSAAKLSEVDEATRLLGLKTQIPLPMMGARVIHSTRPSVFSGYLLDVGQDQGLQMDQGIIAPEGVVGRIWSVNSTQSKVLPADAPNAAIAVMLARSRAMGVMSGLGSGRAEIRYINNQEVVQPGEAVLTSGMDRVFPRGLLVGYVSEVKAAELELKVKVNLSAPLDRLHLVLIVPAQPPLEVQPPFFEQENKTPRKGAK